MWIRRRESVPEKGISLRDRNKTDKNGRRHDPDRKRRSGRSEKKYNSTQALM